MRVIGIDPGAKGAIVCIEPSIGRVKLVGVADMPALGAQKDLVSGVRKLSGILYDIAEGENCLVAVEHITVRGSDGVRVTSVAKTLRNASICEATAAMIHNKVERVHPQTWEAWVGIRGKKKDASRHAANGVLGYEEFKLKKHVDRADAFLIACYILNNAR